MASNKRYWKSEEELNPDSSIADTLRQNEFIRPIPVEEFLGDKATLETSSTTRRDFLKYVGFSTVMASMAACEGPVIHSVPYVVQPEEIIPGVSNYYATTIANGFDFASILVKTREGRPIMILNNKEATNHNAANARVVASLLDMYDTLRIQGPQKGGESIDWSAIDIAVKNTLNSGKPVIFLTQTYASPSTTRLINDLKKKYPNVKHVIYDAVSEELAVKAFEEKYGTRGMADYNFSKAEVIVGIGADFLADWQGGGYDAGYAQSRVPKNGKMSKHIHFESNMSLTGANADVRVLAKPSEQKIILAKLYAYLSGKDIGGELDTKIDIAVRSTASQLKKAGSKAVVVTGIPDKDAQSLVLEINELLRSEIIDTKSPILTRQANFAEVQNLVTDMQAGNIAGLIMDGVNPVYTLPNSKDFVAGLQKVDLSVTFSMKLDETAQQSTFVAAAPHFLESWGDAEIKKGNYSLMQPTIRPLFNTKQFQEAILGWLDIDKTYYEYVRETWSQGILGTASWEQSLHDGFFVPKREDILIENKTVNKSEEENIISPDYFAQKLSKSSNDRGMELVLYTKVGMGDGQQANNPWLQEFPDPITRVSWDNYVTMSKTDAKKIGVENWYVANGGLNGRYVKLTVGEASLTVPVIVQPGQAIGTLGLSLGYGKKMGLKKEMQTGQNAYSLYQNFSSVQTVKVEKANNAVHEFACVQMQSTLMGRGDVVKETTLEVFNSKDAKVWNPKPVVSLNHKEVTATDVTLWDAFDRGVGHHFNLSIDLNACTGCGACVIACHAENNVPVVGKEEIRRARDMHWLRIDRYYSSTDTFEEDNHFKENLNDLFGKTGSLTGFEKMEDPSENPQVVFQPVMCQHCNHAPCETVCPVAATSHGRQGQNHMAYNRCVGTRYCANNCPYKVRRFNWFLYNNNDKFDYHMNSDLGKMVLNPDVVVRSRGVMEKCSFCIQATQAVILNAKKEGRPVAKGEFNDACACSAACSSGAMRFGDINEEGSPISELIKDQRAYHLLEHVGTLPNVVYQVKVRNHKQT